MYDVEIGKIALKLEGHSDDINAVCFADSQSSNVLFSGSDDSLVKVWDRRSMAAGREAGCLPGHMEGITFVATKGDGRYVISNGKDQTLKLWDIRKMMERSAFERLPKKDFQSGFDYRWMVNYIRDPVGTNFSGISGPTSPETSEGLQCDNICRSPRAKNSDSMSLFSSFFDWATIPLLWLRGWKSPYLEPRRNGRTSY